jgi:hypothetical protein
MQTKRLSHTIEKFETITLQEMDSVKLMNRVDTKFVLSFDELQMILPELLEDYRMLEVNGHRMSTYESVYFDKPHYKLYLDHHQNKQDRYKVRFREYVESNLSFLEVKHKSKGRTDKRRIVVESVKDVLTEKDKVFIATTGLDPNELSLVLQNSFVRITLVGKHDSERLTFDLDLSFKKDNKEVRMDDVVIAELKQENLNRNSSFYQHAKKHLIRPFRVSKYCIGLIKLLGKENIKYNRFKKKLLKIDKLQEYAA